MRTPTTVLVIAMIGLLTGTVGCSKEVAGAAVPDPVPVPLALTDDGFGIVAGFDEAPARIEIFTEPQCTHCLDLQQDFGDQIRTHLALGELQVTYRPLTFLDASEDGYSAAVVNAMFVAAEPAGNSATTGPQFQRFVEELWAQQDPGGPAPTSGQLGSIGMTAGLPEAVADNISDGDTAVDVSTMEEVNFAYLYDVDPINTGTPTVVDIETGEKVDIADANWLDQLVEP